MSSAERQELSSKRGSAIGRLQDFIQFPAKRAVHAHVSQRKSCVTAYDHEEIIKIMGYTTGKAPHGFHLLGLAQRVFSLLATGDFFFEILICFCQIPRAQLSCLGHVHCKCHHSSEQYPDDECDLRQRGPRIKKRLRLRPSVSPKR